MKKVFATMAMALMMSTQGLAASGGITTTTCRAIDASGDVVVIKMNEELFCLRCAGPSWDYRIWVDLSLPRGPRGAYITESYNYLKTEHYRLSTSYYHKKGAGVPGFPDSLVVLSADPHGPLFVEFEDGSSLDLDCQ